MWALLGIAEASGSTQCEVPFEAQEVAALREAASECVVEASPARESDAEPLLIRADRAWEPAPEVAGDGEVLNLEGNFEMRGPDWRLAADSAQVYGSVEDPERLVIRGGPARVFLVRRNGQRAWGTGQRITYWRQRELVEVQGSAAFAAGDLAMRSSSIIYDLAKERLTSEGDAGVTVVVGDGEDN